MLQPAKKHMSDIKVADIRIDGGTQSRVAINADAVEDYAEALTAGVNLPPVVVFHDGAAYWLADGFHRLHAHRRIGAVSINAEVRSGTQRDAQLFAYGANQTHGLRRTNEDKRKAVHGMLALVPDWSDVKIARHVGVNDKTVAAHRRSILGNSEDRGRILGNSENRPQTRVVERNGTTYTQDISGIQKAAAAKNEQEQPAASAVDEAYVDELRHANEELLAQNEYMTDRLAVAAMDATEEEKAAAADLIRELRASVDALERDLRTVKTSRDGLLVENAELKKRVAYWRKRAEKVAA